jgi:rfaE bifunctional protein kinase chain/domain
MTTEKILGQFPRLRAMVVGDICLDRWCQYDPAAADVSRETGIARIGVVSTVTTAGAGGTVGSNLAALGAGRVAVLGVIGQDGFGYELKRALGRSGIQTDLLLEVEDTQTFTYTKLINRITGKEDLPRVDFISMRDFSREVEKQIVERLHWSVEEFDVILVSDQAETEQGGVVTAGVRKAVSELARKYPDKVFWVDSRLRVELFRDVFAKPNVQEAEQASMRLFGRVDLEELRRTIGDKPLVVTCGGEGARVIDSHGSRWVPGAPVAHPVDICGAGDSFSAGAALTLAVTGSVFEAARIGNLVASVTVMKPGTGTASPGEVLQAEARA